MLKHGKVITWKSAAGGGSQNDWKIARIGDGVFSSKVTMGPTKGLTQ